MRNVRCRMLSRPPRTPMLALAGACMVLSTACSDSPPASETRLVLAGQALIKKDPRIRWEDPYGSLAPILDRADVAFTNFEMAILSDEDRCGVSADYEVSLAEPRLPAATRPGNTGGPHAVAPDVMGFLADRGFNLMSLSNNHAYDLGDCGVAATQAAAEAHEVAYSGTGADVATSTAPGYLTVGDFTIALIAATTSHDERSAIGHAVNGVWTGRQEDWDRNISAVREAAANADFVLFYQHFQIDLDEFEGVAPGDSTGDGHVWVADVAQWQTDFARAVLDAGASMYVGHGHRAFDGVEVYDGKPLIRQLGGLAYQGLNPVIGGYDEHRPWEGLVAEVVIREGRVEQIDFIPLDLDEGETYREEYDDLEFLSRRGLAELASGGLADAILERFQGLSAEYGTDLSIAASRATLVIGYPDGI
jgi:poly-gamma-glutamate capsule biosynthesis protein CapA/YwtB (metallophosphatase superfamily)